MKATTVSKATVRALGHRMKELGLTQDDIPSKQMLSMLSGERLWVTLDHHCLGCKKTHRHTHLFTPTKLPLAELFPAKG